MKSTCAGCGRTVRDRAALCHRCTRALVAYLQSVPGLVADLTIMRSGEQRVAPLMPRVHLTSTPKIPAQITPRHGAPVLRGDRELADLHRAVMDTAARLAEALGVGERPMGPGIAQLVLNNRAHTRRGQARLDLAPATAMEMAAIWCACHPAELRTHPDAAAIFRRTSNAVLKVHAVIDPQRRRYLGPCPSGTGPGDGRAICGARLLATPGRSTVKCTRCRTRYVVADIEADALRRAEDAKWTAAELLEHVLPSIGVHIPRATLYRWAHRHTIPVRGYQAADGRITDHRIGDGDPEVYRLGDVLTAAARDHRTRKANP